MQVFWGPDTFGAREEIDRVASKEGADIRLVDKRAVADKPLRQWVDEAGGGLFGKTLVVAIDPGSWLKSDQEILAKIIVEEPKYLIVWQRQEFDKRVGWYAAAKRMKRLREWSELPTLQLRQWVEAYVESQGGQIEQAAALELVERAGSDRHRLRQEMDKLLLRGGLIDRQFVRDMVVEGEAVGEIFAMLDAVAAGRKAEAMRILSGLLASGESEFYVLSMLGYQLRTLLTVRKGQESGQSEQAVAKASGLHPYVVQKNWRAAQRWRREQLTQTMTRLLATDGAIKRGVMEPRLGVTMMLVGMMP